MTRAADALPARNRQPVVHFTTRHGVVQACAASI